MPEIIFVPLVFKHGVTKEDIYHAYNKFLSMELPKKTFTMLIIL